MSLADSVWSGPFGNDYTKRNPASDEAVHQREGMWHKIFARIDPPHSALEVGANVGANLLALRGLIGNHLYAVEPNEAARDILEAEGFCAIGGDASKIGFPSKVADLVFTCGVLIHIPPAELLPAMKEIHRCADRYVACIEYFSVEPQSIPYRGREGLLFKRDFGGMWLDHFPDLLLRDHGFFWKRATGLDDLTFWIFEKR